MNKIENVKKQISGLEEFAQLGGFIGETIEDQLLGCYSPLVYELVKEYGTIDQRIWPLMEETEKLLKAINSIGHSVYSQKDGPDTVKKNNEDFFEFGVCEHDDVELVGPTTFEAFLNQLEKDVKSKTDTLVEMDDDDEFDFFVNDSSNRNVTQKEELTEFSLWLIKHDLRLLGDFLAKGNTRFWANADLKSRTRLIAKRINYIEERVLALRWGVADGKCYSVEQIAAMEEFSCNPEWIERVIMGVKDTFHNSSIAECDFNRFLENARRCKEEWA